MKVAIIGRGNMGTPLAAMSTQAGHEVAAVGQTGDVLAAVADAALVILAVHYEPAKAILADRALQKALAGKIVVDLTNPLAADFMSLTVGHETSASEILAGLVPQTRVVKAFNTVFADLLQRKADGRDCPVPVYAAGDDQDARNTVIAFAEDLGFTVVDSGALHNARYLEPMAEMMIQLGYGLGHGADIGFALVKAA